MKTPLPEPVYQVVERVVAELGLNPDAVHIALRPAPPEVEPDELSPGLKLLRCGVEEYTTGWGGQTQQRGS